MRYEHLCCVDICKIPSSFPIILLHGDLDYIQAYAFKFLWAIVQTEHKFRANMGKSRGMDPCHRLGGGGGTPPEVGVPDLNRAPLLMSVAEINIAA